MFRNVRFVSICFDIPDVFFLTGFKTPAGFAYIAPTTIGTGYFVDHIGLMFDRWSEFGRRKFLLLPNSDHLSNINPMWSTKYPVPIVVGAM